jgi:hypothetical protein
MRLADRLASLARNTPPPSGLPELGATSTDGSGWADVMREPDPFARLEWLDGRLVAAGFPAMSEWWRAELRRFYASGRRWGVYLVGRGGGKSTTLTRVAACEALFTEREIPPGQRWIWPFVSVSIGDARRRITEIAAIMRAIGVDAEPSYPQGQPTIEAVDARGNPIAFVALAGTIAAVSGPSAIGATVDEEAKLKDRERHANPAHEIIASLVQTFRARPGIRGIRCSSAWTEDSTHASAIREGDTVTNHVGRIGPAFLDRARAGLLEVAQWETERGDALAARQIEACAATLDADSPRIPTWIGNPTIGAVASRIEVDALPAAGLDGLTRSGFWLRENASMTSGVSSWSVPTDMPEMGAVDANDPYRYNVGSTSDAYRYT